MTATLVVGDQGRSPRPEALAEGNGLRCKCGDDPYSIKPFVVRPRGAGRPTSMPASEHRQNKEDFSDYVVARGERPPGPALLPCCSQQSSGVAALKSVGTTDN